VSAPKKSKLIIGPIRISFPWLHAPQPPMEGDGEGKYGLTALFPPGYDTAPIEKALMEAAIEKWGPDKDKWPRLKYPPDKRVQDCSEKAHLGGYNPGWKFVPINSAGKPGVIDGTKTPVADIKREAYPGRWAKVSCNPFAWDTGKGVRGVSLGLSNVQLLDHDEPFTSKPKAEDEFEEAATSSGDWNG
jgi:Protein of unknown function (DUF2815)